MKPTPNACNVSTWLGLVETNPSEPAEFTFAFATSTNGTYTVEHTLTLGPSANWQPIETFYGNGIEKVVSRPLANAGFFRVRFTQ